MDFEIHVTSDSGNMYVIKPATAEGRTGLWCTCPAWRNMRQKAAQDRACKHITYVTQQLAEQYARSAGIA